MTDVSVPCCWTENWGMHGDLCKGLGKPSLRGEGHARARYGRGLGMLGRPMASSSPRARMPGGAAKAHGCAVCCGCVRTVGALAWGLSIPLPRNRHPGMPLPPQAALPRFLPPLFAPFLALYLSARFWQPFCFFIACHASVWYNIPYLKGNVPL